MAFDLKAALAGHPIGFSESQPCHRFTQMQTDRYTAVYQGVTYLFDHHGHKIDSSAPGDLIMLSAGITEWQDKKDDLVTRSASGDSGSSSGDVTIAQLKPRDYFAQEALNGILKGMANPIELKDYDIKELVALSYKIAQEMLDKSIQMRATHEQESEEVTYDVTADSEGSVEYKVSTRSSIDGTVSFEDYQEKGYRVAVSTLSNNTEKLLYNIWRALDAINVRDSARISQAQPLNKKLVDALVTTAEALNTVASHLDGVAGSMGSIATNTGNTATNVSNLKSGVDSIATNTGEIKTSIDNLKSESN